MTGIVLCGGQSTRMGTDKGLLKKDQQTWTELAISKLKSLKLPVAISINKQQSFVYSELSHNLLIDDASLSIKGPLLGLMTAHTKFPDQDLLALACDMLDVNLNLIQGLMKTQLTDHHEACVYIVNGRPQPLCGIYTAAGLNKIHEIYQQGGLQKFSMMHVLELLNTCYMPADPAQWQNFNNYNSMDDVEQAKV